MMIGTESRSQNELLASATIVQHFLPKDPICSFCWTQRVTIVRFVENRTISGPGDSARRRRFKIGMLIAGCRYYAEHQGLKFLRHG